MMTVTAITRLRGVLLLLATLLGALGSACQLTTTARPAATPVAGDSYIRWLVERSMLHQAEVTARRYSGHGELWQHPYAIPQPRAASALASVWFTAYPPAQITRPGESVLQSLGDPELWSIFRDIGIKGMHTGPMKRAGGIRGHEYTPTVDGNFDRISSEIDPGFGTEEEYKAMVRSARENGAVIIGDIIPGHSGKGADFRLAERRYGDYPGLYYMVEIQPKDWSLLPPVAAGKDSINLKPEAVDELKARGYIVGRLPRTIFYEKGVKETDWSATDGVAGADGKTRRWVYLHYFKEGQPTFNWLDPTFAAQRLVAGDALHSLGTLGERMLRLDANGFLGIEIGPSDGPAWSEGHPLSVTSNQLIAGLVRKIGGFTFQELNLTLEDIKAMSQGGADLSYDFVTRPAYHHALVTGDAEFLRLMLGLQKTYKIDPATLIHALQNHDELTLELVHFWTRHKDAIFTFRGKKMKGSELRQIIRADLHGKNPGAAKSGTNLPRTQALYGPLPEQLKSPGSFASQLQKMLRVRAKYRINESEQVDLPPAKARGLVVMVHRLPAGKGTQVTAINFGRAAVQETMTIKTAPPGGPVTDLLEEKGLGKLDAGRRLPLALGPHEGRVLLIK